MTLKRNIIFFIDSLSGGGAERVCALLSDTFSKRRYNITIVTIKGPLKTDYKTTDKVDRISLRTGLKSSNVASALINNVTLILTLRKLIKSKQPDIIISLMTEANITCSLACINVPTLHIASERNYPPANRVGTVWHYLRKYAYRLPNAIVSQTPKTSTWMMENTKCKLSAVIPNPVEHPIQQAQIQVPPEQANSIPDTLKVILGVGRLVDQKQFSHLVATFSKITVDYPEWILVIAGEGPNHDRLQQQINTLMLQDKILLIGRQANIDFWYKKAEIFVLTSKYEGYPNALLEAMCYGVAPVSYNCDTGPGSIIQHEHNGLLVPVNDEKQLALSLRMLIDCPQIRVKIGNNAKIVGTHHSVDSIADQWESLFDRIVRSTG